MAVGNVKLPPVEKALPHSMSIGAGFRNQRVDMQALA
jgi:hypothetical protein